MESELDKEQKLATLYRQLGRMCSDDVIANVLEKILEEKLNECNLTLLGKFYSRPNVNF